MTEMRTTLSVQVASITGYLIGVKEEIFNREFKTSVFHSLERVKYVQQMKVASRHYKIGNTPMAERKVKLY